MVKTKKIESIIGVWWWALAIINPAVFWWLFLVAGRWKDVVGS